MTSIPNEQLAASIVSLGEAATDFDLRIAAAAAIGVWLWAVLEFGDLVTTGPPLTNVNDFRAVLVF